MDVVEYTKAVEAIVTQCKNLVSEPLERAIRLLSQAFIADSPSILQIFWLINKMAIVADEVAHESRQFRQDIPENNSPYGSSSRANGPARRVLIAV